ncbi:MAG TPA: zf-HC2 domain-containing protein [bacterium]
MTHLAASQRLSAYLDGELADPERQVLDAHLRGCTVCRRDLAELARVKSLLSALPEVEPPPGLLADLREAPARLTSVLDSVMAWLRSAFRRPAVAAAAVMLALLLIVLPIAKGRLDRLQAANVGVDVYVHEQALFSAADPFADPAYLGLLISDANIALVGQRRSPEEDR